MKLSQRFSRTSKAISLAGILAGASCGLTGCNTNAEPSEKEKIKNTGQKVRYIRPELSENETYILENGSIVTLFSTQPRSEGFTLFNKSKLIISITNGEEKYKFGSKWPYNSLFEVLLFDGQEWEPFTRDNMDNYASWNQRYVELIDDLYAIKSGFEGSHGKVYDRNIRSEETNKKTGRESMTRFAQDEKYN